MHTGTVYLKLDASKDSPRALLGATRKKTEATPFRIIQSDESEEQNEFNIVYEEMYSHSMEHDRATATSDSRTSGDVAETSQSQVSSTTPSVMPQPPTDRGAAQPQVDNVMPQPPTDRGAAQPQVDSGTPQPPTDRGAAQPQVDSVMPQPPADHGAAQPQVDSGTQQPPTDRGAAQPQMDSGKPQPSRVTRKHQSTWYYLCAPLTVMGNSSSSPCFRSQSHMKECQFVLRSPVYSKDAPAEQLGPWLHGYTEYFIQCSGHQFRKNGYLGVQYSEKKEAVRTDGSSGNQRVKKPEFEYVPTCCRSRNTEKDDYLMTFQLLPVPFKDSTTDSACNHSKPQA